MSNPMMLILSNCPPQIAEELARSLVQEGYAACITLSEVKSVYRWEGALCSDQEVTLTAKVSAVRVKACVARLVELHPYDVPEVICLPVDHERSYQPYCTWVAQECAR